MSAAIYDNPFTAANSSPLAEQNQQTPGAFGINWQIQGNSMTGDFPSAHTMIGTIDAITLPSWHRDIISNWRRRTADFAYDLNVYGVHYPTDVIGGRILATYVVAETLAGNPLYPSATGIPANIASLSQAMQGYLGGGASSPYAASCAGSVAACIAGRLIPSPASYAQIQHYTSWLTYGLPPVSDTTLAPVVPTDAHLLIATRFPYLNTAQLNQVLATTELPSGGPIDNGTGWARLNLYAAASGYGAFPSNVTVSMNAALGGLNAFDIWSNADLRPRRPDAARLRHPGTGRQQQLYRRHRRAGRHARGHRHGGRQRGGLVRRELRRQRHRRRFARVAPRLDLPGRRRSERREPAPGRRHRDAVRRHTRHRFCRRRPATGQHMADPQRGRRHRRRFIA